MNEGAIEFAETPAGDVRTLTSGEGHARIFRVLRSLPPGGLLRIKSDHDPRPLHYQLEAGYPGKFAWEYLEQGPKNWRIEISRLDTGCDCCCGEH